MSLTAELISIGDEILYGQTLDTNSHWISQQLDDLGIKVGRKVTIEDLEETILESLSQAESRSDIVIITGGLGPTNDDLTKPCLTKYFNTTLVRDSEMLKNINNLFAKSGREMSDLNQQQADLPANCTPIPNVIGTAPGMWFEEKNTVFISMPGVPYEMKRMMTDVILPKLRDQYVKDKIFHRIIRTIGIPESKLAAQIKDWEDHLPQNIKLAYLPTMGSVKLRLTANESGADMRNLVQQEIDKVVPSIQKYVYGFDDEEIEQAIGRLLVEKKFTLATAESCTGGFLSHRITSVPGSSKWFKGGVIPYSNQLKMKQLQVGEDLLKEFGAVSEPVVKVLAENARKAFATDVAVSISGIAGPGGGTEEKPVGTVWIGYSDKDKTLAKKFQFTKDRGINIHYTAVAAMNMIRINLPSD